MQAWTLFLVSIERGTSRRVYHRRPWLFDTSQLGGAPCWLLARPGCGTRRCRRTEARNVLVRKRHLNVSIGGPSPPPQAIFHDGLFLANGQRRYSSLYSLMIAMRLSTEMLKAFLFASRVCLIALLSGDSRVRTRAFSRPSGKGSTA